MLHYKDFNGMWFLFVANGCGVSHMLDIHTAYQAGNTATNCDCDEDQAFSWNET